MTKDEIFDAILGKEGGYVNHPDDKGGPTNWGITQAVARAHGYSGDMRNLTRQQALDILTADYWTGPRFDLVSEVSPAIAAELCDTGVNMGPSVQTKWFQRWLNVFNIQGTPPNLFTEIHGDAFAPRNPLALKIDFVKRPPYFDVSTTHRAKTWLLDPRAPKIEPPAAVRMLQEEGK